MNTTMNFGQGTPRKGLFNKLNESRFESFNRSPIVDSSVRRVKGFSFNKQLSRKDNLFGTPVSQSCSYETNKDHVLQRLDKGITNFKKERSRSNLGHTSSSVTRSIDQDKVIEAQ